MIAHGYTCGCCPAPLEQNDMPHGAVKRFSRCSENRNPTDVFEQQGLEPHWLLGCWGNKHQQIKIATKSYAYLSYWRLATELARRAIPEASIWTA